MDEADFAVMDGLGAARSATARCDSQGRVRTLRVKGGCDADSLAGLDCLNAVSLTGWEAVPELPDSVNALRFSYPQGGKLSGRCWDRIRQASGSLTFLELSGCGLTELPSWLSASSTLRYLRFDDNQFDSWPKLPPGTATFAARDNRLRRLPSKRVLSEFEFHELDLAGNRIAELSEWLRLRKLRKLDVSRNDFVHLPSRLASWQVKSALLRATGNDLDDSYLREMNSRVLKGCHPLVWGPMADFDGKNIPKWADFSDNRIDYLDDGWLELDGRNYPPCIGI